MESTLTRNEKLFIILGMGFVTAFLMTLVNLNHKPNIKSQFEPNEAINYNMAKPEETYSGYSLDGRKIDSYYDALAKEKKVTLPKENKAVIAQANKTQTAAIKKLEEDKKKELVTARNPLENHAKSIKSNATPISSRVADIDKKVLELNNYQDQFQQSQQSLNRNAAVPVDSDEKNRKSFLQWRTEIFAKPSKEVLGLFINAHRKGEVTSTEFQAMAQDLIDQEDVTVKGLGLMVLRSEPSMASLSQLVYIQEQLPQPLQAYVEQAYLAYLQPQYIFIFEQVFQSKNKKLVAKSLSFLNTNLQKIRSGDVSELVDGRQRRDADLPTLSVNNFKTLLPSLAVISSTQESDVAVLAGQVAGFIQSNLNVAGI